MIRVLHFLHAMNSGGIESFLMNIYRNIDRDKIQFDFLLCEKTDSNYEREIENLGGRLFFVPTRREGIKKNKLALRKFFEKHQEYKILHMHVSCLSYMDPIIVAKRAGVPVRIVHAHSSVAPGNKIHLLLHYINKYLVLGKATDFFSCSDVAMEWLYANTKYMKEAKLIYNGIDCRQFSFDKNIRNKYRESLGLSDRTTLVHVGRFSVEKNHVFLLEIFEEYLKNDPKAILLLVGNGKCYDSIKNKIDDMGLKNNAILLGVRSDISQIFQAADINLLPSLYEGFPVSLAEAQATGIPCVYSDTITKSATLMNNVRRVSITEGTQVWVKAIEELLKLNRETNSNKIVIDKGFDIVDVTDKLIEFYQSSIRRKV
ncbi:glycosyltransferase family 1 protein [Clostridium sp.]|uniref:glycosyltransferase family 1 protein n=1 Tax=Clostridium sp. TaxID=1506 RepID=UPI0029122BB9|nr:glycosyltransferase family 1 protein [Clostridium sp.]MDU3411319.1 glycosyltransferase family 1 protein [Clostridium sp.]